MNPLLRSCCLIIAGPAFALGAETLPASLAGAHAAARAIEAALPEKMPACDIVAVESESNSRYVARADGAWVAGASDRPGTDVITLKLQTKSAGDFLRLDFPTDGTLPAQGPGLADNGNSVINEIEIQGGGRFMNAKVFSAISQSNGGRVAERAFDGAKKSGDKGWDAEACGWELGGSKPARLVVRLDTVVRAGTTLIVRLTAQSQWGRHVPGAISAAVVGGAEATDAAAKLATLRGDFDRWCFALSDGLRRRASSPGLAGKLADEVPAELAQAELLRSCGVDNVWAVATRKGGDAFLRVFLADRAWTESFLLGGVEGTGRCDFGKALENLRLLHSRLDKSVWSDPVLKRLATAMSLQAGDMNRYRFVERFGLIRKAREDGLLHAGFDTLDVRAMRHAINLGSTPFEFRGWLEETQFTAGGYLGACWAVPYVDPSVYGFSIQAWGFHDPLRHAYSNAKLFRSIGGVCGTLSGFGATSALTHGVPAFTVGQPAHCAYVVRLGDRWGTGNDVSGPATNSWSAYEGVSFMTTDALLEKIENAPERLRTQRMAWVARFQREAGMPTAVWANSYEQATAAQPLDYALRLEYLKALESTPNAMTPAQWLAAGMRAATAFKSHHEAGWALAMRYFEKGKDAVPKPADRAMLLCRAHRILNQKAVPPLDYGYPLLDTFLNRQADWIGDPAIAVAFYGELLAIHRNENPNLNWVFAGVLGWGSSRFSQNPATATRFAKAMGDYFAAQGAQVDKGRVAAMITQGVRNAAGTGNLDAYRSWMSLARRFLPPLGAADVHLDPGKIASRPKPAPFPGTLLSATGMLRISSVSYDVPLSHDQVIGGGDFGYFDTANEPNPWAKVTLAGDGELSGIVLVSRFDYLAENAWDVPLKVEISTDDKTWTQVALFEKADTSYRVDLRGKGLRARYVRIERQPGSDPKAQPGRLHLRNFLVYGKKLY